MAPALGPAFVALLDDDRASGLQRLQDGGVEHRVSAVLGKFGVDSHAAAIAAAHARNLLEPASPDPT